MAFRIMLDAGHFAKMNQSPVMKEYYESEMDWDLVNYLKAELEEYGIEVGTTRENKSLNSDGNTQPTSDVYGRGKKAEGYDAFFSLHSNACGTESVDRVVVYYPYDNVSNSKNLADILARGISVVMGTNNKAQIAARLGNDGSDYYGVMRGARDAFCYHYYIVEHSFHTNLRATQWLYNRDNLKLLAVKEAEVIANYFGINKTVAPIQPIEETTMFKGGDKVKPVRNVIANQGRIFGGGLYNIYLDEYYVAGNTRADGRTVLIDSKGDVIVATYANDLDLIVMLEPTPGPSMPPPAFPDVAPDKWYYMSISDLAYFGIVNGYPDGTFKPEQNITRAEVAQMISNLKKYMENK